MARLDYDDSASIFFFVALISALITPFTLNFLLNTYRVIFSKDGKIGEARTLAERSKIEDLQEKRTLSKRLFTNSWLVQLAVLSVGWLIVIALLASINESTEIASFDPFAILGIDAGTEETHKIKRAYRKLSLVYHPDKWVTAKPSEKELAAQKFMMVAKAYEALTNDEARENWIKFGNPDGRQALQVSIGLPSWLMERENQNVVLVVYLVVLVVLIPLLVGMWYSKSRLYAERGVLIETYQFYAFLIDENILTKHLIEVLALSAEFRVLPMRGAAEKELLAKLERWMKQDDVMVKKPLHKINTKRFFETYPNAWKANVLLHVHCNRMTDELTPELQEDLQKVILPDISSLIEAMLEITTQRNFFRATVNVIELQQFITQALWVSSSELLQLPHFGKKEVRHCSAGG